MFVLASGSPRRLELLNRLGFDPQVIPADIDETPRKDENPIDYVLRMAREKCESVFRSHDKDSVLGADTIVALGNKIFGKAPDNESAHSMLTTLQGQTHQVTTAIALRQGTQIWTEYVTTEVTMKNLDSQTIQDYLTTGEYRGKAGAYAIQGIAAGLITKINGSVTSVIGLPLMETIALLEKTGVSPHWSKAIPA